MDDHETRLLRGTRYCIEQTHRTLIHIAEMRAHADEFNAAAKRYQRAAADQLRKITQELDDKSNANRIAGAVSFRRSVDR